MKKFFALILTCALTICSLGVLTSCGGTKFDESKSISVVTREDGSGTKSACNYSAVKMPLRKKMSY